MTARRAVAAGRAESCQGADLASSHTKSMVKVGLRVPLRVCFSLFASQNTDIPIIGKNTARILADMGQHDTRPCVVYYLADPRTPRHPRYVGFTENPESRAKSHAKVRWDNNQPLCEWRCELCRGGVAPMLIQLAAFPTRTEARAAEWRLIRRWQRRGLCDLNAECGNWDATKLQWAALYHPKAVQ